MLVKCSIQKYCLDTSQLETAVTINSSNGGILSLESTQQRNPMPNSTHLQLLMLFFSINRIS